MMMPMTLAVLDLREAVELAWLILTVSAMVHLLADASGRTRRQKIAWGVAIVLMPFVGAGAYWWVTLGGRRR